MSFELSRQLPGKFIDDVEDANYWTGNVTLLMADGIAASQLTESDRAHLAEKSNVDFTFKVSNFNTVDEAREELNLLIEGITDEMQERQDTVHMLIGSDK